MKQFLAFISKEFYHMFRDPKTLLLLFGMPIAQILLFGFALTNEIKDAKIVVIDYAQDNASKNIIHKLSANPTFDLAESHFKADQIESAFKKGSIKLAVIFPLNFEHDLAHSNTSNIQIIADASDPNTATALSNYASAIIQEYQLNQMEQLGLTSLPLNIDTQIRMIYNPELKGATNYVPGVMALVLLLVSVLMTSVSIVREKELGTMEILLVSPVSPLMVIISKAVPYFALSILNLTMILLLSYFLLELPIAGSLILLYFASSLLILTGLALGLLISNSTDSQQTAMLISLMGMLVPTILFSGFMFPIENMPWVLQVISNVVPSKWYYIIIKDVMIKGLGFSSVWQEMLILSSMGLILLLISLKKFKIRLA